jgi:hypothetical protein
MFAAFLKVFIPSDQTEMGWLAGRILLFKDQVLKSLRLGLFHGHYRVHRQIAIFRTAISDIKRSAEPPLGVL